MLGVVVGVEAQLEDFASGVPGDQRTRRSLSHDLAMVHDDKAVAQLLGLVHVVRSQHQGHARALEAEQPVPQNVARLGIKPRRGLIQEQDLRTADQRAGNGQASLHPT